MNFKMEFVPENIASMNVVFDIVLDTTATEEFTENMDAYLSLIRAKASKHSANVSVQDLYQDVYVSLQVAEMRGEGYDPSTGFTVKQFISGRIEGYLKNAKYRGQETNIKTVPVSSICGEEEGGLNYIYNNTASDVDLENEIIQHDIEESLRFIVIEGNSVGVNLLAMIKNPEDFVGAGNSKKVKQSAKNVLQMLSRKLSKECLTELWEVLSCEDKGARTLAIEKIERELDMTGALWGI